jgi:hypothetical protein
MRKPLVWIAVVALGLSGCKSRQAQENAAAEVRHAARMAEYSRARASKADATPADAVDYERALARLDSAKAAATRAGVKLVDFLVDDGTEEVRSNR